MTPIHRDAKKRAGSADVIADYDGSDAPVATHVTPGLDNNISQTRSGSTYYYMRDGLGSVRNLVDSSEADDAEFLFDISHLLFVS